MICFHFIIFVLLETAQKANKENDHGCDLLSFHYLCAIRNSGKSYLAQRVMVVICFHFIIFVLLETAKFIVT